jgi:hypothetical protein
MSRDEESSRAHRRVWSLRIAMSSSMRSRNGLLECVVVVMGLSLWRCGLGFVTKPQHRTDPSRQSAAKTKPPLPHGRFGPPRFNGVSAKLPRDLIPLGLLLPRSYPKTQFLPVNLVVRLLAINSTFGDGIGRF